jgi:hypothetical protein
MSYGMNFWGIFEAGLSYSVNPASFLGCILFLFFLFRMKKAYDYGVVWPGGTLLLMVFITQFLIHIGTFDFLCLFVPGFLGAWDLLRIFVAVISIFIGIWIMVFFIHQRHMEPWIVWETLFYWKLDQESFKRVSAEAKKFLMMIKSVLWGIFFAFFCGMWPLHRNIVYLMYQKSVGSADGFFSKFLFFELVALVPFFLILLVTARSFLSNSRFRDVFKTRGAAWAFSAVCIGSGLGTLIYYFQEFI